MDAYGIQLANGTLLEVDGSVAIVRDRTRMEGFLRDRMKEAQAGDTESGKFVGGRVVGVTIGVVALASGVGELNTMSQEDLQAWDDKLRDLGMKGEGIRVVGEGSAPEQVTTMVDSGSGDAVSVDSTGQTVDGSSHIADAFAQSSGGGAETNGNGTNGAEAGTNGQPQEQREAESPQLGMGPVDGITDANEVQPTSADDTQPGGDASQPGGDVQPLDTEGQATTEVKKD